MMTADVSIPSTEAAPTAKPRGWRWMAVSLLALVVAAGGYGAYWYSQLQLYHFDPVEATKLYRSGNRGLREFDHAVQASHARTVISLVDDRELHDLAKPQFAAEAQYCQAHGIHQVRLPVPLGGWPTTDQINQFLVIVNDPANRPVLVHCAQGVRRTGMFVAAYQLLVQDRTKAAVKALVKDYGHKPKDLDDVRTFIDEFDVPNARAPTPAKAVSGE